MSGFVFDTQNPDGSTGLYTTGGTAATTVNLNRSRFGNFALSDMPDFAALNGKLYFIGTGTSDSEPVVEVRRKAEPNVVTIDKRNRRRMTPPRSCRGAGSASPRSGFRRGQRLDTGRSRGHGLSGSLQRSNIEVLSKHLPAYRLQSHGLQEGFHELCTQLT